MAPTKSALLVFRAHPYLCGVPLLHVLETMRPLPIADLNGMPGFVLGLSVIRGTPIPVVDAGSLLGKGRNRQITRFVTLRIGDGRWIALAVGEVLGIREMGQALLQEIPPLLQSAGSDAIEAICSLEAELLIVLQASKILCEDVWQSLEIVESVR